MALERKLADLERELTHVNRDSLHPQDAGGGSSPVVSALGEVHQDTPSGETQDASGTNTGSAGGVLIDEAVERRYSMEARETVFGEIPATKDVRQAIDLADLVRFRERMQITLQGLIDEYSQLLSLKPPTDA
jgi:hypothetical protein